MSLEHDVWKDAEGCTMLCHSGDLGLESKTLMGKDATIIYSFFAASHFEAMTKYYEFMDWGIYDTEFETDKEPYDVVKLWTRHIIRLKIDQVFWENWDPLGINDVAPRDEYQGYIPQILNLVMNGGSKLEIADRLYHIEIDRMGLVGNKQRCEEVADQILPNNIF